MPSKTKHVSKLKRPLKKINPNLTSLEKPEQQQQLAKVLVHECPRVEDIEICVRNVVTTFSTKCMLNLREIGQQGPNVEYERGGNKLYMRIRQPLTTAIIFSSGKINCVGAKSEADAYRAARRYCRILQKIKPRVKLVGYRVVNVLASCTLPFTVEIRRLAYEYQRQCTYEPEMNSGAVFRLQHLSVTATIFNSGKVNMTAPSVQAARQALNHLYPIIYEFKREFVLKNFPVRLLDENNNETETKQNQNQDELILKVESVIEKEDTSVHPALVVDGEDVSSETTSKLSSEEASSPEVVQTEEEASLTSPPQIYHDQQTFYATYEESLGYNYDNTLTSLCFKESRTADVLIYNEQSNSEHLFAVSSDTMMSAASSYSMVGSGLHFGSSQPLNHWFNENLLIDTVLEDFLPWDFNFADF